MTRVAVIGVGNLFRRDDAAGLEVTRRLREHAPRGVGIVDHDGEPAGLLDLWTGRDLVFVVDAVRADVRPGAVHRLDAVRDGVPPQPRRDSSHHLGLGDAVELGRALGRLPGRLVLIGIEGSRFEAGEGLSPEVEAAVAKVTGEILDELGALEATG